MSKGLCADLSLAIYSLLWGATFVVVKNALDHASVFIFSRRALQPCACPAN